MPQFCVLFYANYTIPATQRGGMAHHVLPLKYALDYYLFTEFLGFILGQQFSTTRFCQRIQV